MHLITSLSSGTWRLPPQLGHTAGWNVMIFVIFRRRVFGKKWSNAELSREQLGGILGLSA
jgi:hypothetical protein